MEQDTNMVRDVNSKVQLSITQRLSRLFRRTKVVNFPLEFSTSVDEEGNFLTKTFMVINGEKIPATDIQKLWSYGCHMEEGNTQYVVDQESLTTLLSIRSMNPEITQDGTIKSKLRPSILKYLRRRDGVNEEQSSKNVTIQDKPLKPGIEISYQPTKGLVVKPGYAILEQKKVIQLSDIEETTEDQYIKYGNSYYQRPEEKPEIKRFIETHKELFIELSKIPEFFKRDLVMLKTNFTAILTEDAARISVEDAQPQPWVRMSTSEGGWLNFDISYKVGQYEIPFDIFSKSKTGYIQKDDYTWLKTDPNIVKETEKQLDALGAVKTETGFQVELTQFQSLEEFVQHIGGVKQVSADYQNFLNEISDFQFNDSFELPASYESDLAASNITLRPYQRSGIQWLNWLSIHHLHGILADDMGLGKTLQTITAIRLCYDQSPNKSNSLVVCPKSVVGHWSREIARAFPLISTLEYTGPFRNKHLFKEIKTPTIFITTYETLANDINIIKNTPFLFVALDEGTKIKNPNTKRSMAVKKLNSAHRLIITGTPIENTPTELWSIFDFLMKRHLGSYGGFASRYESKIQAGDDQAAHDLANRIKPFILRRLKADVAKDLPEKIEMKEWCELTEEQQSIYGQLQELHVKPLRQSIEKGEKVNYTMNILPIITKLKQVCDHPALINKKKTPILGRSEKFDLITEKMVEITENKESTVLFSHFLETLDLFEDFVNQKKLSYIRIDGSTQNRQQQIDKFNDGQATVALCSLMAGGHGINLTAASHIFHVDRWWNPAIENQATDRVHRIGQTRTVYVYKILVKGTLEEKIDKILQRKQNMSDKVIGAATKDVSGWTREELLEILEPVSD